MAENLLPLLSPSISSILDSNTAPDDVQAATIQDLANELDARIKPLLEQRRRCHSALSAIRRIPQEILSEIFVHAAGPFPLARSGMEYVGGLRRVCKSWNMAALSTHKIWSSISIPAISNDAPATFLGVKEWLSRSGSLRKELAIDCDAWRRPICSCMGLDGPCVGRKHSLIERLLIEGPLLDHVIIKNTTREDVYDILRRVVPRRGRPEGAGRRRRPWDQLRAITLNFGNEIGDFEESYGAQELQVIHTSIFGRLPKTLASFTLIVGHHVENMDIPSAVLQRLSSFTLFCAWSGDSLRNYLKDCSSLESLVIELRGDDCVERYDDDYDLEYRIKDEQEDVRVILPHLQSLRVRPRTHSPVAVWDLLQAPSLSKLRLDCFVYKGVSEYKDRGLSLLSFIETSQCASSLHTLHLYNLATNPDCLLTILTSLPNLSHLVLDDVSANTSYIWYSLSRYLEERDETEDCYLSSLRHLELLQLPFDFDPNAVAEVFLGMERGYWRTEWVVSFRGQCKFSLFETTREELWELGIWYSVVEAKEPYDEFGQYDPLVID